jgi:hypothetical protein
MKSPFSRYLVDGVASDVDWTEFATWSYVLPPNWFFEEKSDICVVK